MSRILRRPMFRGGPVDSYGTGIASGLTDGGRIGYQRAGFVTGQQIVDANRNNLFLRNNPINLKSKFIPGQSTGGLDNLIRATMFDTEQYPLVGKESGIADTANLLEFYEAQGDEGDEEVRLASLDTSTLPKINTKAEASELEIETEEEPKIEEPEVKKQRKVEQPTIKETEDNEVTMTDLERALGLDDARKEYVGDALAAASKAFFEGRGFEAISDAARVKSKAPDIKRLAGLEEFKAKKAKELYETKLDAQLKQKLGTRGALQKDIEYLSGLSGADRIAALGKLGYKAPSLSAAIKELKVTGQSPDPSTIVSLAELYIGPDFKGVISADTQPKEDGTYILEDASALMIVSGGKSKIQSL